ncbi:MAG: hypothetical protein E6K81_12135 [Candidatus Eisenbacteria bacterium]|uniref:Capsule assembly Wzi family protein n=1 Tax=Eiseniibacteriota bacterium TaxID=2212470 RepID=A0A538U411_UNCEI|nr:MAG: hypothetical protein E6K81_12135 [Candidatus Eisenbacteria bacterium]
MRRLLLLLGLAWAGAAWAQPLEPPPEAPAGADYTIEPADSVADGEVEVGMGAAGHAGSAPTRTRRMRFSGGDLNGSVREGSGDPLAGGAIAGHGWLGDVTVGRLAPRWGRGLVLGAAADPWQREALDRGERAAFRGRAGDGVWLRRGHDDRFEALVGRFAHHPVAGARVRWGGAALGALTDGRGARQSTLSYQRGAAESELAWDRAGHWRAEAALERPLAEGGGEGPASRWTVAGRVRAGAAAFASLAEPGRRGPAQALAASLSGPAGTAAASVFGAVWRFRPGVAGARAGLAVERPLAHHGALEIGLEEQRGSRRDAGSTGPLLGPGNIRRGLWGEWWSGEGTMSLGLRHEVWGERPWARGVVRAVTGARIELQGPAGVRLGITHSLYRVRSGESLYLREAESDRLVLRAMTGEGARTRVEARSPFAGGRMRAALLLAATADRRARTQWTLDWTRRARLRGSGGARAR